MSLQNEYDSFRHNYGSLCVQDPEECLCKGHGWVSSPFDTYHECPVHYDCQRHPESDEYAFSEVTEVTKVVEGGTTLVYQVTMTLGHSYYEGEEAFIHHHEFPSEEKAREFGKKIEPRDDISKRVQNPEYWTKLT